LTDCRTHPDRDPRHVYQDRLEQRRHSERRLRAAERRLSWARLLVFVAGLAPLWVVLYGENLSAWWLLPPVLAFIAVARAHERLIRRRERMQRAVTFYEHGLARLDHRWAGHGRSGEEFQDPDHPYASDLDLFGRGSLYELLCAARTRVGERTLASWLGTPGEPEVVRERQQAVAELRDALDLREELAVLAAEGAAVDPDGLVAWGESPPRLTERWPTAAAAVLAAVNVYLLFAMFSWFANGTYAPDSLASRLLPTGLTPIVAAFATSMAFMALFLRRITPVLGAVDRPYRELKTLSATLARLERERFRSPRLTALRAALETRGRPPSGQIGRLAVLIELKDAQRNMIFAQLGLLLLLPLQLAFSLERWRGASGPAVRRWVDALGEFEALSSLARFAYENPEFPFPEIVEGGPSIEAEALAHPLIPGDRCVANDVSLGAGLQLLLISGSNMSGKSTLMRTVGVNVALALAGAPIRGKRLRLSRLAMGACMRVQDSLQEGLSHFYAEIKRLKRVVDLGREPLPLLFLLDEILHGTNSHDRRVGAEALIRGLVERGAIGMVTTHDLALASIADTLSPQAMNVHFEDHLENGEIVFDYRLREGVVQKSNALELMRAVGLDV
jgi:hypothetical protein